MEKSDTTDINLGDIDFDNIDLFDKKNTSDKYKNQVKVFLDENNIRESNFKEKTF